MSEDLNSIIEKKRGNLGTLCLSMENLKVQFIDDTALFAAKWYEETARQFIARYPDTTLSLTKEDLANLKTKVSDLVKNSKKIVQIALSNSDTWWHMLPNPHASFFQYEQLGNQQIGNKYPEVVDNAVRRALGELGTVLEHFGYSVTTTLKRYSGYPEYWFVTSEDEKAQTTPYYPHSLDWSENMREILKEYNEIYKQAIILSNEIQKIIDEKKRREVLNLWDTALP
jgi:hypothetical protein